MVSTLRNIGLWFLKLYDSGKYQFLPLPQVVWVVAVVVVGISFWKMGWSETLRYLAKHRHWFSTAVVAGVATSLMFLAPWKPRTIKMPSAMYSPDAVTSVALILVIGMMATSEKLLIYWRRYLRTLCIPEPPAQTTLVAGIAIVIGGLVLHLRPSPFSFSLPEARWPILALELGLWMAAPLLWAVQVPESKVRSRFAKQNVLESSQDYSDEAIETEEQDLLGRRDFAQHLADEIVALPGKDSFVFGLNARWGEGKSSILNLIKRRLEERTDIIIVDFNPWYFTNEIGILEAFYGSIERAIEARFLLPSFKRQIRHYLKTLSIGLDHKPFSLDLSLPENPEHQREELEGFIARTGTRLLILLDDIDRLDKDLALSALALTRLSARFKKTIFLLAFDAGELQKKGIDSDFLGKIIQKPIVLPPAEHRDIDGFFLFSDGRRVSAIDSLLDELGVSNKKKSQFHTEMDLFYPQNLRSVFLTMRDVKRFLNVLRPSLAPVIEEVKLSDFFLLTILQVFVPEIYKDIWENRQFYLQDAYALEGYRFSFFESDKEARKKQVQNHIEGLLATKRERGDIKEVIVSLFPDVATALGSMMTRMSQQRWSQEQRLSDPVSFPRYFLGRIPTGKLSDGEAKSVVKRWNEAGEGSASSILDDLQRFVLRKQIQELVERVTVFAGDIDSREVPKIALGIAEFTKKTNWDGEQEPPSPNALLKLALAVTNRLPADLLATTSLFVEHSSIYFTTYFVSRLPQYMGPENPPLKRLTEKAEIRFHKEFIKGDHDIFTEYPRSFQIILYQWATAWHTRNRSDDVENYVIKKIEKHPYYLGRLLTAFSKSGDSFPDWFLQVGTVLSPNRIVELLDQFGDKALGSDAAISAAAEIQQAVAKASGPPSETQLK